MAWLRVDVISLDKKSCQLHVFDLAKWKWCDVNKTNIYLSDLLIHGLLQLHFWKHIFSDVNGVENFTQPCMKYLLSQAAYYKFPVMYSSFHM